MTLEKKLGEEVFKVSRDSLVIAGAAAVVGAIGVGAYSAGFYESSGQLPASVSELVSYITVASNTVGILGSLGYNAAKSFIKDNNFR